MELVVSHIICDKASISLLSKLQWASVFDFIKYREVVLPNASKIDLNPSPFHVDL